MATPTLHRRWPPSSWCRWLARVWAMALFLFWGLFFVEHTVEWFVQPTTWPPPYVIALQGVHFSLLLGLLLGWRWELIGGLISLVSAVVFFPQAAGPRAVVFLLMTIGPAVLWIGLAGYEFGRKHEAAAT